MAKKVTTDDIRNLINKEVGDKLAYNLRDTNPTEVKEWIPTGSTWLDSIICKGRRRAGIPVGKISSIAGLSATGKSYMAAQIAANAIPMGIKVVYFDSESAIDPEFLEEVGVNLDEFIYVAPDTVEDVLNTIDSLLTNTNQKILFIWDSLAFSASRKDLEGEVNPNSTVAQTPRILSLGLKRLMVPLAKKQCTLLVLNQLKTRISANPGDRYDIMAEPYFTPGGLALKYSYSLEIWLTKRKAKSAQKRNEDDFVVGGEVKLKIKKSRFGSELRECVFNIEWGQNVRICDEESWFYAIQSSPRFRRAGAWYEIDLDGKGNFTPKFRASDWMEKLENNDYFKKAILDIMDEELVYKFADKRGDDRAYYDIENSLEDADEENTE